MSDLISRESAIVRVSKVIWDDLVAHDVKEVLKDLPSAQRWIPCSERLPDCEGEYLVTWGTINVRSMCVLHYDQWGDWTDEYDNVMDGSNVVAWMPLPEPYKEDDR